MDKNKKNFRHIIFVMLISIFLVQSNAFAILDGIEHEEEVDATAPNSDPNVLIGYNINSNKSGLGVLSTNSNTTNVLVKGSITSEVVGVREMAGNVTSAGAATIDIEGDEEGKCVSGKIQGIMMYAISENSDATLYCQGDVLSSNGAGAVLDVINKATGFLSVYGSVRGASYGIVFNNTANGKTDALVTKVISGASSVQVDYGATLNVNLTVWKLEKGDGGSYFSRGSLADEEDVENFAKRVNYIIDNDGDVTLKKENGSLLDDNYGYSVAHEGEKVIIEPRDDGVQITKAYNNGVLISNKDANGKFYIIVRRGGGNYITVETAPIGEKEDNPMTLKGKTIKVNASALAKKSLTRPVGKGIKISNSKGTLSFKKKSGKKKITIDKNSGKITIKKGLKKGKYKVVCQVTASGDDKYKKLTSKVTFTVVVK